MTLGFGERSGLMMRHGCAEQLGKRFFGRCRAGAAPAPTRSAGRPAARRCLRFMARIDGLSKAVYSASEPAQIGQLRVVGVVISRNSKAALVPQGGTLAQKSGTSA